MARVRSLEGREAGILARIIQGVSLLALGRSLNPIKVQARAPRAMLSSRVEYWGFLALAAMMPFLLWRLLNEERILTRELPGYAEYRQRVRHRLVPMVW
jgi:protein-S-isoprenylcysteine O-methyltransferase Ste14